MTRALALVLALALVPGAHAASKPARSPEVRVRIVGVNDLHGQITAGRKVKGRDVGSAGVLASWIRASLASAEGPAFIALAGDCAGASPAASALLQDEPTVAFLNLFANEACDAEGMAARRCNIVAALGNHEFDEGWHEMLRLWGGGRHANGPFLETPWRGARFPVLCANVVRESTGKPLVRPSVVLDADGVRIAFVGAVVSSTPSLVLPTGIAGLRFLDEADAVNAEVKRLRARSVRAIVLVIHEGGRQSAYEGWTQDDAAAVGGRIRSVVARLSPDVDLVVSGHSHQFTNARLPRDVGGPVLVTQAWSAGAALAEIDLVIDRATKDVTSSRARILTTWADEGPGATPAADAVAIAKDAERAVAPLVERVVATIAERVTRDASDAGESALGNLVADAQRSATGADIAFMNPGGLRTDLGAGEATWGELFALQPFGNVLVTLEMTGEQVLEVLEQQYTDAGGLVLQVSGMSWVRRARVKDGRRVLSASVGGAPLDPATTYRVTVNSFLAAGGDDFSAFTKGRSPIGGPLDLEALVEHLRKLPQPVRAEIEGRIRVE